MPHYATRTHVNKESSVFAIQTLLAKYGADRFAYAESAGETAIAFALQGRRIRFVLRLPQRSEFARTPGRQLQRSPAQIEQHYQQAVRQCYRALLLAIRAKLEAIDSGIETFEEAFFSHIVMPDGQTLYDWAAPQVAQAYLSGRMPPPLLPPG